MSDWSPCDDNGNVRGRDLLRFVPTVAVYKMLEVGVLLYCKKWKVKIYREQEEE